MNWSEYHKSEDRDSTAFFIRNAVLESPPEQEFLVLGEPCIATILILPELFLVASARYSTKLSIFLFIELSKILFFNSDFNL